MLGAISRAPRWRPSRRRSRSVRSPSTCCGPAALFQRAEVRDVTAWLRVLADPRTPRAARALTRPPIELRSVDLARCTQIARRRKLDMVAASEAALESPQLPPEARERIHRLSEALQRRHGGAGQRRARPLCAPADRAGRAAPPAAVRRPDRRRRAARALRALGELAALAAAWRTPRTASWPDPAASPSSGCRSASAASLEADGCPRDAAPARAAIRSRLRARAAVARCRLSPGTARRRGSATLLGEQSSPDSRGCARPAAAVASVYRGCPPRSGLVLLAYSTSSDDGGATARSAPLSERATDAERQRGGSTRRSSSARPKGCTRPSADARAGARGHPGRAGGSAAELRLDTDLDVSHGGRPLPGAPEAGGAGAAPVRAERRRGDFAAINTRLLRQAASLGQQASCDASSLDDYPARCRARRAPRREAIAARDEPSLEPFLPRRGDGRLPLGLGHRHLPTCPLKYKFARVFGIPREPTLQSALRNPRPPSARALPLRARGRSPELLELLEAGWRRGGFGDCEEERQLRGKARAALTRYHQRWRESRSSRSGSSGRSPSSSVVTTCGDGSTAYELPGRLRADRLQDRPTEEARSCARTSSCRCTRSGRASVAPRGLPPGLLLRAG